MLRYTGKEEHADWYPVNVIAMQIGWILNSSFGKKFLFDVWKEQNFEMYRTQALVMIIEFLYYKFKRILLILLFPLQIAQLIFYVLFMLVVET